MQPPSPAENSTGQSTLFLQQVNCKELTEWCWRETGRGREEEGERGRERLKGRRGKERGGGIKLCSSWNEGNSLFFFLIFFYILFLRERETERDRA